MATPKYIAAALAALPLVLAACGGGGDPTQPASVQANPKAIYPVQILRPCETTGPGAPPCPASTAAG